MNTNERDICETHPRRQLEKHKNLEPESFKCGYWIFSGKFLQKFRNQTSYICIYGLTGCLISMSYAYFNGIITTLEKRFEMPSKALGFISTGNDISQMLSALTLTYYAGRGHRPRWMGFGLLTIVWFCLLTALPQLLYGAGQEALDHSIEYGHSLHTNDSRVLIEAASAQDLCRHSPGFAKDCRKEPTGNFATKFILFSAHFLAGIGCSLYYTLGYAYMDDNTDRNKTATMFSLAYFLNMMGPALGYNLASLCLSLYIAPTLHPTISPNDPRWLGAWWLGWIILSLLLGIFGLLLSWFPKKLPQSTNKSEELRENAPEAFELLDEIQSKASSKSASIKDLCETLKRLLTNKIYMLNNLSSILYFFGQTPYWLFTPKYIEIQFHQSASAANFVTGNTVLLFTGLGVLISGLVISKCRPKARTMVAWNAFVGFITMIGMLSYALIGCSTEDDRSSINAAPSLGSYDNLGSTCARNCQCDFVAFTPMCGADNKTYISPCHAGCRQLRLDEHGETIYFDCSCIQQDVRSFNIDGKSGSCPIDCSQVFILFLAIMCVLKFIDSTSRTSNFLINIRSIDEQDKSVAMGLGMFMMSLLTLIPSPLFFGWLLDKLCLVWGETCSSSSGNCWLYDIKKLRWLMNSTAAMFVGIGAILDCIVWRFVRNLKIFDDI